MKSDSKQIFVCLDCETTGLDPEVDHLIEVAATKFTYTEVLEEYETLIDPRLPIPPESIEIHHITDEMVQGQPVVEDILPQILSFVGSHIIVGHGIGFDIEMLARAAEKKGPTPHPIRKNRSIDTLRMARLYGKSPSNSLEMLRKHFNIESIGAHRAMSDVIVNIEVFKQLAKDYHSTKDIFKALSKPIKLRNMPLGKHKGRPLKEIPQEYLQWAANKDFDEDLLFTIRSELKRRKKGNQFGQATNPFHSL